MIHIRTALREDAPGITMLLDQLGYPETPETIENRLTEMNARSDSVVLVAEDDRGKLAGCIHVTIVRRLAEGVHGEIASLVVHEGQRSQGTGDRLVQSAAEWLRARGLDRVRVRCNAVRERTHGFYERLGFQLTKTQRVFDNQITPWRGSDDVI